VSAEQPQEGVSIVDLVAACDEIERALLLAKVKTPEQIDAQRPGGVANPESTALAWLDYLRWLDRVHVTNGQEPTAAPASQKSGEVERAIADALAEAPEAVECSDGETRFVYPKSFWALQWLDMLNQQAAHSLELIFSAREQTVVEDLPVLQLAPLMQATPLLVWAWILTSKGPALPFDDDTSLLDPPAWTKALSPDDFFKLLNAHRRVNSARLRLVSMYVERDPSGSGGPAFSVAGFIGAIAGELEPNAARTLMRSTSLGQIFGTRVTAAVAAREAMKRAKAHRET
jgi:hypothetical protein